MCGALERLQIPSATGGVAELGRRQEDGRLGEGVGQNMEQRAQDAKRGRNADAHIDVANLRGGGIGDHTKQVVLPHGAHRTGDHAKNAEDVQQILHAAGIENPRAVHIVDDLQQQQDIALRDQAGQDACRGRGSIAIGAGRGP